MFNEYAISKLPTSRDNFNYSTQAIADLSWVTTDTTKMRVDPVNEKIEIDAFMDGSDDHVTFDLGAGISDTWTLRGRITFVSDPGVSGAGSGIYFGLSDNKVDNSLTQQENAYMGYLHSSGLKQWGCSWGSPSGLPTDFTPAPIIDTLPLGVELYWELKRDGNVLTGQIFNNSDFTDSRGISTLNTISAGEGFPENLRFIKFYNRFVSSVLNRVTWEADNIEFWDRGQQGDITFQDSFLQKPVTFSDNFTTDQWVDTGAGFGVNTGTGKLEVTWQHNGADNHTSFDLGVGGISEENWVLRFKARVISLTKGPSTGIHFAITDTEAGGGLGIAQDSISGVIDLQSSLAEGYGIGNTSHDNANLPIQAKPSGKQTVAIPLVTDLFVELKRVGNIQATMQVFTDATYTTPLSGISVDVIPSAVQNLRFIKFFEREASFLDIITYEIDDLEFYNGNSTLTDWLGAIGNDVRLDIINNRINFDIPQGVQRDELLTHDLQSSLGFNASDDNWTLRFKINTDNIAQGTSEQSATLFVGLDDGLLPFNTTGHDLISFRVTIDQGGAGPQFGAVPALREVENGQSLSGGSGINFPFMWTTGTLYVELKRLSPTLTECTLYTDATFRNVFSSVQLATTATLINLRYIRLSTDSSAVANDTTWDGFIDDIEFYNGVSVPRTPISEIPKLFEDNVVTDKGWVTTDATAMAVNLTTQVLDINVLRDSTQDAIAFDLGAGVLSETRWGLRFKYDITAIDPVNTATKRIAIGLFDTDQTASIASPQDYIGVNFQLATDTVIIFANATNNANPQSATLFKTFTSVITQVQTYYVEIIRISATSYSVEIFSDPDYAISLEKVTLNTISSLISGLRFIKFLGDETSGPATGSFTGTIDDIQLWNGQAPLDHRNKWRVLDL